MQRIQLLPRRPLLHHDIRHGQRPAAALRISVATVILIFTRMIVMIMIATAILFIRTIMVIMAAAIMRIMIAAAAAMFFLRPFFLIQPAPDRRTGNITPV